MDARTFQALTGRQDFAELSPLNIDKALQEAFNEYVIGTAVSRLQQRSNIRSSILPKDLGVAVHNYTSACMAAGAGAEVDVAKAFRSMCEEIARIV